MPEPLLILKSGNTSFIPNTHYSYSSDYRINGQYIFKDLPKCKGNNDYMEFEGNIEVIESSAPQAQILIEYKLSENYKFLDNKYPAILSPDSFIQHGFGGSCITNKPLQIAFPGILPEFYEGVYKLTDLVYSPVQFIVIDDCQPVNMIKEVKVDFPYNLKNYPQTWHKYPCHIEYTDVFNLVHDALSEIIDNSEGKYLNDSFRSIQYMTVSEIVTLHEPNIKNKRVYSRGKWQNTGKKEKIYNETIMLFSIKGKYDNSGGDYEQIKRVEGKNYQDLMENLNKYIQSFTGRLSKNKRKECPNCKGSGVVEV